MIFEIVGEHLRDRVQKRFFFDNVSLEVSETPIETPAVLGSAPRELKKTGPFGMVKIQLGLKCNYSCAYCLQPHDGKEDPIGSFDVEAFVDRVMALPLKKNPRFQFWGGEPLVYWKILKPLAEALRKKIPEAGFSIITNGSLITKDKVDWLVENNFAVAMSHDAEGQPLRGADPLKENAEAVEYMVDKLLPLGQFSISSMLTNERYSRSAIMEYFMKHFKKPIPLSELGFVEAHNDGSTQLAATSASESFAKRRSLWQEMRFSEALRLACFGQENSAQLVVNANRFISGFAPRQKCGMDSSGVIAINLKGDILTCQNTHADSVAPNGNSHKIGNISNLDGAVLNTVRLLSEREGCPKCPVVALCGGSCMILEGEGWNATCENSFTDYIARFAIGFEALTGYVPVEIIGESLPLHRRDIWGSLYEHVEPPKRKVIPIAVSHN